MISETLASPEAGEPQKGAVLLGFSVRRGTPVRHAVREIRRSGPLSPLSAFPTRREELEEEILALWEG